MILQRRGKNIAIAGAILQFVFTAVMGVIWLWTGSLSAASCVLFLAGGVGLWLMVAVLFYCRQLQRREAMELEEIAAGGAASSSIFERADSLEVRPAAARAAWMERWAVPVFTLLWAGYHFAVGALILRYLLSAEALEPANAAQGALFAVLIAFMAFLFSRYATGMAAQADWRLLRPGGSYLLVSAVFTAAVAAALLAAYQNYAKVDFLVAHVIPVVQFLLGAELVLNFVLDFYRPRTPGAQRRPSFETRLFNYIAEPGRIGHSIAETLNYQFGFEVSRTWFYQLIARAALPLGIFAALVLVGMSAIVPVREGQQCVIQHWGRKDRTLQPGIHLKWPWPIDTASRFQTSLVHEIMLGVGEHREPTIIKGREVSLWTERHGVHDEIDFLMAVPPRSLGPIGEEEQKPPPPVNLIKLVVAVQYVISDPYRFGYEFVDAPKQLECIAYREMLTYCASATLDSPVPGGDTDRAEAMMTYGRQRVAEELKRRIQASADQLGLGVTIKYVGMLAVHPPSEVAEAYEAVLEAERGRLLTRYEAETEANRKLVEVAGTPLTALKLALAIRAMEELQQLHDNPTATAAILAGLIRSAEDDVEVLAAEIEQERLMGRIRHGAGKTAKQALHDDYAAHLKLLNRVRSDPSGVDLAASIADATRTADQLLARTVGQPAKELAEAEAYRSSSELIEMARAHAFSGALQAYTASPNMYMMDRWLDVWDEVLPGITKYVIGVDRNRLEVRLNWETHGEVMGDATFKEEDVR